MLREIVMARRPWEGGGQRRWFQGAYLDLLVAEERGTVVWFQLIYDKAHDPHLVEWAAGRPCGHYRVDEGDFLPMYKGTPVLCEPKHPFENAAIEAFVQESAEIEPRMARAVADKLEQLLKA
jgi:hypothetical protein